MATFAPEEQIDFLLKKIVNSKAKGGTSDSTAPSAETKFTHLSTLAKYIWKDDLPATAPSTNTAPVTVFKLDGAGSNTASSSQTPLELTGVSASGSMTGNSGFYRQWAAIDGNGDPMENWIGGLGGNATWFVRVFIGPTGWGGESANVGTEAQVDAGTKEVFEVLENASGRFWFFDFDAGTLYWANENGEATGGSNELGESVNWDTLDDATYKVYIVGWQYTGAFGVGSSSFSFNDLTDVPTTINGYGITDALELGTTSTTALAGDTTTITAAQASAITANTAKTSFPGFGTSAGTALEGNTALLQLGTTSSTALAGDTTTITAAQASAITANTAKTSFPGFGTSAGTALEGNTALLQLGTTSSTALAGDTTTITAAQASAITANTAKTSFPGFGTSAGTALEGNTALLQLGTTSSTALAGDTTTITAAQASAITANTAKTSFPGFGTSAGTALEGNTALFSGSYNDLTNTPTLGTIASQNANGVAITGGTINGTAIGGSTAAAGTFTTLQVNSNATITGNLTVAGDFISQEATIVTFRDTFLDINVAATASDYTTNSGFRFGRSTSGADTLDEMATFTYYPAGDVAGEDYTDGTTVFSDFGAFRFTRHKDSSTGDVASADNVLSLKFNKQDSCTQADQTDGATTMADDDEANATVDRSLGAVAKARITITNTAENGDTGTTPNTNYAPDTAAANGYPIRHNLATQSVYVIAIKDPAGTPTPVYCKYEPIDNAHVRVTVGTTSEGEVYDIIVIG